MTYRYLELALYPKFKCHQLRVYTREGELIDGVDGFQELVLWSRKVISYSIEDGTLHAILDFDFDEFKRYK